MSNHFRPSFCIFILLWILSFSEAKATSFDPVTSQHVSKVSTACQAVVECLNRLDANETCQILPILPQSFIPIMTESTFNLSLLRGGVWMYDDGNYNSLIMKHNTHLVVIDAPDPFDNIPRTGSPAHLNDAVDVVLNGTIPNRIDMLYSHAHYDHIGGATLFYNYARQAFPKARFFIWGTRETRSVIRNSKTKRAIEPNVLVGRKERTLSLREGLKIEINMVGGHTVQDLRFYIPPYEDEAGIVMYVDGTFPGYVPAINMALTENFGGLIKAQKEILKLQFEIFVPGHLRIGTKRDVELNVEYAEDLIKAAMSGVKQVTFESLGNAGADKFFNPAATEFGNRWFLFVDVLRKVQIDACYRIMLEKWGCRLSGMDSMTRGHCLVAINYVTLEL